MPLLVEVGVQLEDLLLGDLHLLEAGGDLLDGQEPPLLAFRDQRAELVELRDGCLVGEQYVGLGAQSPILLVTCLGGGRAAPGSVP